MEQKGKYFYENEHLKQSHDALESVNCFSSIGIEYRSFFPVKIKTKPCIVLLRRKLGFEPPPIVIDRQIDTNLVDKIAESNAYSALSDVNDVENNDNMDPDIAPDSTIDYAKEWDVVDTNTTIATMNELRKPTKHTKLKIKRFLETHFSTKQSSIASDSEQVESTAPVQKQSAKSSIRNIIKSEKIKEIAERISQMDLKSMCDLEKDSVKSCLIKIIDEHESD